MDQRQRKRRSSTSTTAGKQFVIGVDIGGTKVAAGLVKTDGTVINVARRPMVTGKSAAEALKPVCDAIDQVLAETRKNSVGAIGVSAPGWVDSQEGMILSAANLPCWRAFRLAEAIENQYQLPTRLANDAKVAALAEAVWGAGSGYHNVFYVSLGTGIGTATVLGHQLYGGHTGFGGEGGHMTIDFAGPECGCGKRGCIEMYASGTAIARRARKRLEGPAGTRSRMFELVNGDISRVTAEIVGAATLAGDTVAKAVLQETAEYFAAWLGNIIDLLEPEVIVIGGGLGQLMREFVGDIRSRLDVWSINPHHQQIPIRSALYGSESGIVGSGLLCLLPYRPQKLASGEGRRTQTSTWQHHDRLRL